MEIKWVNLTSHEITILSDQNEIIFKIPSSGELRCPEETHIVGCIGGIPITETRYMGLDRFPKEKPNIKYIVSKLVYESTNGTRRDFYFPNQLVRDLKSGKILGCRSLCQR